jgi:hypothetical protein
MFRWAALRCERVKEEAPAVREEVEEEKDVERAMNECM